MGLNITDVVLDSLTADPTTPADGCSWYRSDLNEFRARRNGITISYASKSDIAVDSAVVANTAKVSFPEAPNDANQYARKGLAWEQISSDDTTNHDRQIATSTTIDTTTSSVYSTVAGMSITTKDLGGTGTYIINFNADVTTTQRGNDQHYFVIRVGGVTQTLSERRFSLGRDADQEYNSFSINYMVTGVASGTVIDVRFRESSGATLSVDTRSLTIDGVLDTNVI